MLHLIITISEFSNFNYQESTKMKYILPFFLISNNCKYKLELHNLHLNVDLKYPSVKRVYQIQLQTLETYKMKIIIKIEIQNRYSHNTLGSRIWTRKK